MANYNPYNNIYMQDLQGIRDRVDAQMRQLQQSQMQMQQQQQQQPMQPITQNFQLAPTQTSSEIEGKYASNIDEVKNTFVLKTGIFTTKDFSTIWIKDISGNIRTFKTEEIIELDPKDTEINELKQEIENMKALMAEQNHNTAIDKATTTTVKKKTK